MTPVDRELFGAAVRDLAVAFQKRLGPVPLRELIGVYFSALESSPLAAVLDAAATLRDTAHKFPTIAEWRDALPAATRRAVCPADARWMGEAEADALAEAYARNFQADPCGCWACVDAGVSDRPVRFVPGEERAFNPRLNRLEVVGSWAHGAELAAWYRAREAFQALKVPQRFERAVALLCADREPGEEG
jgi:hypothetical protein